MVWDGEDRRRASDWIERDRMLTETHQDVRYITKWIASHEEKCEKKFLKIESDNAVRDKVIYGGLGAVWLLIVIINFIK